MESLDLKSGKIVDKILSFENTVDDYRRWYDDQRFREGNIVGNGRVYAWLDESDIDVVCLQQRLTPRQIVAVREEFDRDRLNGIWDHCCEIESDHYVDWMAGCAFNDYREKAKLYGSYLRYQEPDTTQCYLEQSYSYTVRGSKDTAYYSRIKHYLDEFKEYLSKGMTQKDVLNFYLKEHAEEIKMLDYLNILDNDPKDVWGGKYPVVVSASTAEIHEHEEVTNLLWRINNAEKELTNKKFYDELLGRNDRWQEWDSVKEVVDLIDYYTEKMNDMQNAVEFVLEYIKGVTSSFKEILTYELSHEIGEFIADEHSVEERVQEGLVKINTFISVNEDEVVTDQHAHAKLNRVKEVIEEFRNGINVVGQMIGSFKINKVFEVDGETYFKIGCHLFKLSEVEQKLAA
jgi:hypothetical protein